MRWPRFLLWNVLGAVSWATTIGIASYFRGRAAAAVLGVAGFALLALFLVGGLVVVFVRRVRHREHMRLR